MPFSNYLEMGSVVKGNDAIEVAAGQEASRRMLLAGAIDVRRPTRRDAHKSVVTLPYNAYPSEAVLIS